MAQDLSIYVVPPVLSLLCGLYLVALALLRGRQTTEKLLFALVCIWYSLLAPIFICHQLISDEALLLVIERRTHLLYVFLPLVSLAFVHHILQIRRKALLLVLLVISALFSWTTQGELYIAGLYKYNWGYIAKGGPAFQLFGLYGAAALLYCVALFWQRLKVETDPKLRVKFTYVASSFGLAVFLTFLNIPAMHGVDFYPPGNFSFLPMAILAYALLKYRLVRIGSLVQSSMLRAVGFVMILVPNIVLYDQWSAYAQGFSSEVRFLVLAAWFLLNYIAITQARKVLGKLLSKTRRQLQRAEAELIKEMLVLGQVDRLRDKVSETIRANLPFTWVRVYVYDEGTRQIIDAEGRRRELAEPLAPQLSRCNGWIERQDFKQRPDAEPLIRLLAMLGADYLIPLVHQESLVGLLALPYKANRQPIHPDEAVFIRNIAQTLALAISNALMFQKISALKDNLQARTEALSKENAERKRAEKSLQAVQEELEEANFALQKAILQANEMTSKMEVSNYVLTKEMEERKRVEAALRQSEAVHRLIAENSTDVIWTIDLQGRFTYLSPSVRHLLQYTPQEMLALKIEKVLTPASYTVATEAITEELKILSTPEAALRMSRATELEQVRKDGTTVWTEVNTRFIKNEQRQISGILGVTRDITERRKSEQDLLFMAYHDTLTGLYNRKAFLEFLDNEIKYAQRYGSGLVLLYFDLNRFKQVNDSFGHEIGDQLLKGVASRLKAAVRDSDIVFRLGGDEFTIILKTPEEIFSDAVVRRIIQNLSEPYQFDGIRVDFVSASIGIAAFPQDGTTAGELMKNADQAMYESKKSKAAWCCFTPALAQVQRAGESQTVIEGWFRDGLPEQGRD
jgi:diguanylate cyclase (GGDEF)-like protein/PAS domain S-box-containing protein